MGLFSGLFSLFGANKDRKFQKSENELAYERNRPVNQVSEWELAGINPLFGLTSGSYVPAQATQIGDAYATAGARFGQAFDEGISQRLEKTKVKQENEELRKKLDELATPRVPSYMVQYGGALPLPGLGGTNAGQGDNRSASKDTAGRGNVAPKGRVLDDAVRNDKPYIPGTFLGPDAADPPGSQRIEAEPPSQTLAPISFLGMTARGTGTTTAAHVVEDNAGDVGGSAWGIPVIADYAIGTYSHNIGRPFADWLVGPGSGKPKPPKANTKTKRYRDFMKDTYPTVFD